MQFQHLRGVFGWGGAGLGDRNPRVERGVGKMIGILKFPAELFSWIRLSYVVTFVCHTKIGEG